MKFLLVSVLASNLFIASQTHSITVILDPAHGGKDPGVQMGELKEKDLTLKCATIMENIMLKSGFRVLLTRERDTTLPQEERAGYANKMKGDFFISLHVNFSFSHDIDGTEIYLFRGKKFLNPPALIKWKQVPLLHVEGATRFGNLLIQKLSSLIPIAGIKKLPLYPVLGVNMPSIVIELEPISSPKLKNSVLFSITCESFAKAVINAINEFQK